MQVKKRLSQRHPTADSLRGLALVSMVLYHSLWSAVYQRGLTLPWFTAMPGLIWQQSIAWSFILLAGYSFPLGRHPLNKGAILLLIALGITCVTLLVTPDFPIYFGVLHFLGLASLFTAWLRPLLQKISPVVGLLFCGLLFAGTYHVPEGYLGFQFLSLPLPQGLYHSGFTALWGLPPHGFRSADYFPLLPWFFLYLVGYFSAHRWSLAQLPVIPGLEAARPLLWAGSHSLVIYLVHQPLIQVILCHVG